ncbi:hypothetical protein D3C76_1746850 [compost metagenome]
MKGHPNVLSHPGANNNNIRTFGERFAQSFCCRNSIGLGEWTGRKNNTRTARRISRNNEGAILVFGMCRLLHTGIE